MASSHSLQYGDGRDLDIMAVERMLDDTYSVGGGGGQQYARRAAAAQGYGGDDHWSMDSFSFCFSIYSRK